MFNNNLVGIVLAVLIILIFLIVAGVITVK